MSPVAIAGVAVAFVCVALMGYAIQRGATCMVAAIDEIMTARRANRLIALGEAAIWVAGGLLVADLLGYLDMPPAGQPIGGATLIGGALLGLGALVSRGCVFGVIARFGSGDLAYALSPIGFFLGCLVVVRLMPGMTSVGAPSPVFGFSAWLAAPFALFALWRGIEAARALRRGAFARHIWSPHRATMVIGIAFVVMLLAVGNWAYTDALASLAQGGMTRAGVEILLFAGLLAGATVGGWTAGRLRFVAPTPTGIARALIGGVMMGMGSVMIPGSNDGLLLLGVPLLQPHAFVALAAMALAIASGMALERRLARA